MDEAQRGLTFAQIVGKVNFVTAPKHYACKKRKEYIVHESEVRAVLDQLMSKGRIEEDKTRRKYDPKAGWPTRYRKANLLTQIAFAAQD